MNNSEVKSCGLVIGAFKPYTAGHHFLITKAAEENELVFVYVSQKDRNRKGEHAIPWKKMKIIWNDYIIPKLPNNVTVVSVDNPINNLYNFLHAIDENNTSGQTKFNLYMDDKDKVRYCYQDDQILQKYPRIHDSVKVNTFNRESNVDVSATKMRKFLQEQNSQGFKECLPDFLHSYSDDLFNLLF